MSNVNRELFETMPVPKAVRALVAPTVLSQLITVVYNMADTFFIGQIGDPNQVAAASLCMPLFIFLTGLANLFGIGGSSLIARSLGAGDLKKARNTAAFAFWTAAAVAALYGAGAYLMRAWVLPAVGANAGTYDFCAQYLFWTIGLGAVPTVLSALLAHLVRAQGFARPASFGMALGGVLNIALDPLFIFGLHMGVAGAAIATCLSNLVALGYFLVFIARRRDKLVVALSPKHYTLAQRIPAEVLLVGLPSSLMNLMGVISNITLNRLMAAYCNEAVAGIGIAKKIDMLCFAVSTGMSQGVLPLVGYCYSAGKIHRMMQTVRTAFLYSLVVATAGAVALFAGAGPIVRAFIDDAATVAYGRYFQRVICITGPCIAVTMIIITLFQAVGKKGPPLFLSLLRKGGLDIPFMLLLNALVGLNGVVWATPIGDFGAMLISLMLFIPFWRSQKKRLTDADR